jgi:quercetin dioxygenase-like cupin family protein
MAIPHAASGQAVDIPPLEAAPSDRVTKTLFKTSELEVMRLVVLKDKTIPRHQVAKPVVIQCLEGRVALTAMGRIQELRHGQMLHLPGGEPHALQGLEDASILVTILL